jgi:SAM-dependent methyltransferase
VTPGPSLAAEIGRAYDAVPYDGGAAPALGLAALRGAAAALGLEPSPGPVLDVLDIGCGAGAQLLEAARHSPGRMVGIDASAETCARARARGAHLGERWRILHGDAASLPPDELGQFDVIYLVGTAYVMPPPARAAALDLLARCLRPGGVAVVTAYAGLHGIVRTHLAALLRAGNNPTLPPEAQVALARENLRAIAAAVPEQGEATSFARTTIAAMEATSDVVLFHEALGPAFDPLPAGTLEAALAPHGLAYLNHLPPLPLASGTASAVAARSADAWDFATGGGYRTMLFARPGAPGPGLRHPRVVWTGALRRMAGPGGAPVVTDAAGRTSINGHTQAARAQLEALCAGPGTWHHLHDTAATLMPGPVAAPEQAAFAASLDELLSLLWRQSLVWPSLAEP